LARGRYTGGVKHSAALVDSLSSVFYYCVRVPGERPGVAKA